MSGTEQPAVEVPRRAADAGGLSALVRTALAGDRLHVLYQPLCDLRTGRVLGAEALLRMRDDAGLVVPPDVFIPVAEQTGAIHEIGAWVLATAAAQCAAWKRALPAAAEFCIGVNLSPRQLDDRGLADRVAADVLAAGLAPDALVLELTERLLTADTVTAGRTLDELRAWGAHVAVDDFGSGYASLAYLLELPVDVLKLDRSLTCLLGTRGQPGRVASAVARLTTGVGMVGIVEGIETEAEREQALAHGFVLGQGYLLARPLEPAAFTALLAAQAPVAA